MKKSLIAMGLAATMIVSTSTSVFAWEQKKEAKEDLVVGASFKTLQEERWVRELGVLEDVCEENDIDFVYQVSENDAMKQAGQIENMVSQGIDILVVMTNEKETIANALREASEAGVLVCYYESTNGETYADLAGGNSEYAIGCQITQAAAEAGVSGKVAFMYGDAAGGTGVYAFHDGMHDSLANNDIEVVGEQWATNWDPSIALSNTENWIAQYGEELKAVFCMNDGLAGGAIQALEKAGLAGKVIVTGQDCDLVAVQRIIEGTQLSTILKSGIEYPKQFMDTCIKYYFGELTDADFEMSEENCDGVKIPFFKYDGQIITKDNVDDVITAGVYTHEEVYGE